ncbi:phosphate-starvation-inducible PsiE family protein [Chitinophaga sp. ARDCPP14]|uniref:phosphate-starvation-inducible PsiE family protein n=1 Tax=Chitinophaga sp. ARDCPP14 TaxID=3391139 RepID=UPI003F51D1AA
MEKTLRTFEKYTCYTLLGIGMFYITFQIVELLWLTATGLIKRFQDVGFTYAPEYSRSMTLLFFNILLALEILETVKVFEKSHEVKIRIILMVCMIAVSRKILMLDIFEGNPMSEIALAALIVGLSGGYYLINKKLSVRSEEQN